MKRGLGTLTVLVGFMVLALCGPAQATIFTVSEITFSDLVGADDGGLEWSLDDVAVAPFDLDPGGLYTFRFGELIVTNFPSAKETGDSFDIYFKVSPPEPAASPGGFGDIKATVTGGNKISVSYPDQNWIDVLFDTNGFYKVRFLAFNNESYSSTQTRFDLEAQIHYISEPTGSPITPAAAPVPEPSTVVLLGSGLLGLIYVGRKRLRK